MKLLFRDMFWMWLCVVHCFLHSLVLSFLRFTMQMVVVLFVPYLANASIGEELVMCANGYIGIPYDTNPVGEYVVRRLIVYDERMDCMYMVFRCAEIALSDGHNSLEKIALQMRFHDRGELDKNGFVVNYKDRFQYGEDMIHSPKWGRNVTEEVGTVSVIKRTWRSPALKYVKINDINLSKFQDGDIVFLVEHEHRRITDEIIGHMGFVQVEGGKIYFIHTRGVKGRVGKGSVEKVELLKYLHGTRNKFAGIAVKRLE